MEKNVFIGELALKGIKEYHICEEKKRCNT